MMRQLIWTTKDGIDASAIAPPISGTLIVELLQTLIVDGVTYETTRQTFPIVDGVLSDCYVIVPTVGAAKYRITTPAYQSYLALIEASDQPLDVADIIARRLTALSVDVIQQLIAEMHNGVTDHAVLTHLGFDESGHTGFASAADIATLDDDLSALAIALNTEASNRQSGDSANAQTLSTHTATIGGTSLGHVKNGGNVVIEADGTLTAPDPDLSSYATTSAMTAADQALQSQITTNTSAISQEVTNRTNADDAHASLTTSAHGGIVASNDARLSDARPPLAHKTSHATGGSDALTASDIGASPTNHTHSTYEAHIANLNNPHAVTAAQVGALTQTQADARYQLAAVAPSYPTANLVHDFRLIGNLANSVNAFTPAQFAGALLKHNPYIPTGIATRTNGSGLVIFPSTFSLTSGRSIYIVMRVQQLTAWTNFLSETNTGIARGIDLMVNASNQWYVVVGDDVGYVTGVFGTISLNTWLCVTLIYSVGSGVTIAVNNVVLGTVSTTKVLTATTSTLGGYIKDDGIGGQYSATQYATVLQYGATHDSTQRTAVYNGLKADLASRGVVLP